MRRMDRYNEGDTNRLNRMEKNQDLYQDIVNNPKVANITDVSNVNAYELSSPQEGKASRESYQQMKKYGDFEEVPRVKKELDDINYLYQKKEKKVYDINSVLEEARKNRQEKDELEEKRKLKYTSYNVFSGINLEELAKYREEKKKREKTPQEKEIHNLMDTIASKTLAGEISKEETVELLSDLMATNILDKVVPADEIGGDPNEEPQIIATQTVMIEETREQPTVPVPVEATQTIAPPPTEEPPTTVAPVQPETIQIAVQPDTTTNTISTQEIVPPPPASDTQENKTLDTDFFTKSMDLSTKDLEMADDFEEKGIPTFAKVLIVLLIISILVVGAYFVYLKLK
ncbi:MAG: hypothetical protein IKF71_00775 [Bacilli bacterium]|nr:hypothetical protein [Bacilli bacterium]